jgi:ribonuclease Z
MLSAGCGSDLGTCVRSLLHAQSQAVRSRILAAMKVTLLGTGTPIPDIARRGPASLVEHGDERVLVDAGAGVLHRLLEAGVPPTPRPDGKPSVTRILLTHLHSDHITGLADVLWAGWIMGWWQEPPPIYGPPGTAAFVQHLEAAFAYDLKVRRALDRKDRPWQTPQIIEVEDGWRADAADLAVSAVRVDHHPVDEAFGFRIDTTAGSVGFSGDTKPAPRLVEAFTGVDLLVHEVYSGRAAEARFGPIASASPARARGVASYHTSSYEVGGIATAAEARQLVLNHVLLWGATAEEVAADARRDYAGEVAAGEDLQSFTVG